MRPLLLACCYALALSPAYAADTRVDKMTVHAPWSRATAGPDTDGVGYLEIRNDGEADRLVGVVCDGADVTSLHDATREHMVDPGSTAREMHMMTTLDHIDIPAHGSVVLKPGGLHLMIENMAHGLNAGQEEPCLLRFARTGPIDVALRVGPPGATTPPPEPPSAAH